MLNRRSVLLATFAVVAGFAASGCGSSASSSGEATTRAAQPAGSLDGGGKTIVAFLLSKSFPFIAEVQKAAQAEAAELGYELEIVETGFDPNEQGRQVQQYLATGKAPAAFFWLPVDPASEVNSVRQMAKVAPVFQIDAQIAPYDDEYVTGYAGIDGVFMGRANGTFAMRLRDQDRKAGRKLRSTAGNLLYIQPPAGFRFGELGAQGFREATKRAPFNVLRVENADIGAEGGYKAASQLIPRYRSQGIDYIYATNVDTANGVVKALRESGLAPGKDVKVIAGNCAGDLSAVVDGQIANCGISSGAANGKLVIDMIAQYLASGGTTKPGTKQLAATREAPTVKAEPPTRSTYTPYPIVTGKEILDDCRIWGVPCVQAAGATL